jgi:hypothetical protein
LSLIFYGRRKSQSSTSKKRKESHSGAKTNDEKIISGFIYFMKLLLGEPKKSKGKGIVS